MTKSKGEEKIINIIKEYYGNIKIIRNYHIGNRLYIDIYLPSINMGIEFDGIQHFKYNPFFHETKLDFLKQQRRDKDKDELCKEKGIDLIRIKYNDTINYSNIIDILTRPYEEAGTDTNEKKLCHLSSRRSYSSSSLYQQMKKSKNDYRKKLYRKLKLKYAKKKKKKA